MNLQIAIPIPRPPPELESAVTCAIPLFNQLQSCTPDYHPQLLSPNSSAMAVKSGKTVYAVPARLATYTAAGLEEEQRKGVQVQRGSKRE